MKNFIKYAMVINFVLITTALESISMGSRSEVFTEYSEVSQGPIKFYIQETAFKGDNGKTIMEFSYSMAFDQVQFLTEGKSFKAGYTISIIAYDEKNEQIAGDSWEKKIKVEGYSHLQKGDSIVSDAFTLRLPAGNYRIKATCTDNYSDRVGVVEKNINVPGFNGKYNIGGIRFERNYYNNVIPWPNRVYGEQEGPILIYFCFYTQAPETLYIKTSLLEAKKQKPLWTETKKYMADFRAEARTVIPVDSLSDGNYILNLKMLSRNDFPLAESEDKVIIRNPLRLTKGDYEEKIAQIEYIARRGEIDTLRKASPELRDSLWRAFWKSHDPTPETEKNELRESYYEKINYANQHFSSAVRPGWKTDMGRIFIKYGQPDEIEKHPFDIDSRPYEIWYYYQLGFKLIFKDEHGFGDYKLVYTNKEI